MPEQKVPLPADRTTIVAEESIEERPWGKIGEGGFLQWRCIYCHRTYRDKDTATTHVWIWHQLNGGRDASAQNPEDEAARMNLRTY